MNPDGKHYHWGWENNPNFRLGRVWRWLSQRALHHFLVRVIVFDRFFHHFKLLFFFYSFTSNFEVPQDFCHSAAAHTLHAASLQIHLRAVEHWSSLLWEPHCYIPSSRSHEIQAQPKPKLCNRAWSSQVCLWLWLALLSPNRDFVVKLFLRTQAVLQPWT